MKRQPFFTASILHSLQGKKKYLPSALLGPEAFSDLLWTHALAPSCDRILKLVILSILPCTRLSADGISFLFPKVVLQHKFVVSHFPAKLGLLFLHTHKASSRAPCCLSENPFRLCHLWWHMWGAGHRVGVSVGEAHEVVELPMGQRGDPQVGFPSRSLEGFLVECTNQLMDSCLLIVLQESYVPPS